MRMILPLPIKPWKYNNDEYEKFLDVLWNTPYVPGLSFVANVTLEC